MPGSLRSASLVLLVPMPSPPMTSATRGRVGLACGRLDGTRKGFRWPGAVGRDLRQRAVPRWLGEALFRRCGVAIAAAEDHDIAAAAAGAVDDGDGLGSWCGCRLAGTCGSTIGWCSGQGFGGLRLGHGVGGRGCGCDRHRFAAQRIVDQHRPAREHRKRKPEHGGGYRRESDLESAAGLARLVLSERGVEFVRAHGKSPRESWWPQPARKTCTVRS